MLSLGEGAAKNLIPQLVAVGLIDEDGKPTERAMDWREDATYADACKKILEAVYPEALREAFPPPSPDRGALEQWFARNSQVGRGAAKKMASFYLLVAEANLSAKPEGARKAGTRPKAAAAKRTAAARPAAARRAAEDATKAAAATSAGSGGGDADEAGPSVHVDVQVHISPDASVEQIEHIFASMAKHLYPGRK